MVTGGGAGVGSGAGGAGVGPAVNSRIPGSEIHFHKAPNSQSLNPKLPKT